MARNIDSKQLMVWNNMNKDYAEDVKDHFEDTVQSYAQSYAKPYLKEAGHEVKNIWYDYTHKDSTSKDTQDKNKITSTSTSIFSSTSTSSTTFTNSTDSNDLDVDFSARLDKVKVKISNNDWSGKAEVKFSGGKLKGTLSGTYQMTDDSSVTARADSNGNARISYNHDGGLVASGGYNNKSNAGYAGLEYKDKNGFKTYGSVNTRGVVTAGASYRNGNTSAAVKVDSSKDEFVNLSFRIDF